MSIIKYVNTNINITKIKGIFPSMIDSYEYRFRFRFLYHEKYQENDGCTVVDLYLSPKYHNLKQELDYI